MQLYENSKPAFVRAQLIWTAMWAFCTGIGLYLKPDLHGHGTHQQLGLPPCPSVLLFDRPCPGCGLTTSWTNFLHGHIVEAFKCHPLGVPMYLAFTFVALAALYGNIKGVRLMIDAPKANIAFVTFVVIFFVFGGIRMAVMPGFAGTDKEKAYRSFMTQSPQANISAKTH